MNRMQKVLLGTALFALTAALPAAATDNSIRIRGGMFTPDGSSEYWQDAEDIFTGTAEDLEDTSFAFDFSLGLSGNSALFFSASGFSGVSTRADLDFVDNFGNDILHDVSLDISSATIGYVLYLAPGQAPLRPYVGGGGGIYVWELIEDGDFIDTTVNPPEIFNDFFVADGEALGYFFLAGVDLRIGHRLSLFAEGRWHNVDDKVEGDFSNLGSRNKIDLSGREISAGISFRF